MFEASERGGGCCIDQGKLQCLVSGTHEFIPVLKVTGGVARASRWLVGKLARLSLPYGPAAWAHGASEGCATAVKGDGVAWAVWLSPW